MKKSIILIILLAGSFSSCSEKREDFSDATTNVIGTVVGTYSNGWVELLVQVDKKYPIGKTIENVGTSGICVSFIHDGTYHNTIGVQQDLPLFNFPENETVMNKRISFSYRPFVEEDIDLFLSIRPGNALCASPDVPLYVITECRIIK